MRYVDFAAEMQRHGVEASYQQVRYARLLGHLSGVAVDRCGTYHYSPEHVEQMRQYLQTARVGRKRATPANQDV